MVLRCYGCMNEYDEGNGVCPYCGYEPGESAENSLYMLPGTVLINRYLIGKVVGFGGFGVTYIGWDNLLEQRVAIKEYLPSEFSTRAFGQSHVTVFNGKKAEQFDEGMKKFIEEARKLVRFQQEPGIVRVFDSFEANNTAYIVMEYLDGETLQSYLDREGKIPYDKAVEMMTPVINSLSAVHAAGIIHRDIAPDNIMITKNGEAKLFDFGAARYATVSHSRSLTVIIKAGYSPEEQYRSRGDQGPHTDVYAMGAVLYRMITGEVPPDALERRAYFENKKKDILVPPKKVCKLTSNQNNAILNAMNVRIEDRTPTAEKFLSDLTSTSRVQRLAGKIKAIDLNKWPVWAKILVPAGGISVITLMVLLFTGVIGFSSNLTTKISIGENKTRVPSVINLSVGNAQEKMGEQELLGIVSGREPSDVIPSNMVLRQSVEAGSILDKGEAVELYISVAAEQVFDEGVMPDVSFYAESDASSILDGLGISYETVYEYSSDVASGVVIYSDLPAGSELSETEKVTLHVSKGKVPEDESGEMFLNRSALSMFFGETANITATGGSGTYTWTSSDTNVATVSGGLVTAVGKGTATISASDGTKTMTCSVIVRDFELSFGKKSVTLYLGGTETLTPVGAPEGADITWTSDNPSVVTVSGGKLKAKDVGNATVTAEFSYGDKKYSAECSVDVQKAGISISDYKVELMSGETYTLTAKASGGKSVSWYSSDPSVASVDKNGKVTAKEDGYTCIAAQVTIGGTTFSAECDVYVNSISIDFEQYEYKLSVDDSDYISLVVEPSLYMFVPDFSTAEYSLSNYNVITIEPHGSSAQITAISEGSVTVTAKVMAYGKQYTSRCTVIVSETRLEINEDDFELSVDESKQLSVSKKPATLSVQWRSSDSNVAHVDSSGKVYGISEGSVTITAHAESDGEIYESSVTVTVTKPEVKLSKTAITLDIDKTTTLKATTEPENQQVYWQSGDQNIATVSQDGTVKGVGNGETVIIATAYIKGKTYSAECNVTVEGGDISLSESGIELEVGKSVQLYAETSPKDSSVKWSSGDTSVATVDNSGKVTGVSNGETQITAKITVKGKDYSAVCSVKVSSNASIKISLEYSPLETGESSRLFVDTTGLDEVTLSAFSSNGFIASCTGSGTDWKVTAHEVGTVVIYLYADTPSGIVKSNVIELKVKEKPQLDLADTRIKLNVGESYKIVANVTPADATIKWESQNSSVAIVDQSGNVTAVGEGVTVIYAYMLLDYESITTTCTVEVTDPTPPSLSIFDSPSITMNVGDQKKIDLASQLPEIIFFGNIVQVSSSDSSVASIDMSGNGVWTIRALSPGTAIVSMTVSLDSYGISGFSETFTCQVTVEGQATESTLHFEGLETLPSGSYSLGTQWNVNVVVVSSSTLGHGKITFNGTGINNGFGSQGGIGQVMLLDYSQRYRVDLTEDIRDSLALATLPGPYELKIEFRDDTGNTISHTVNFTLT